MKKLIKIFSAVDVLGCIALFGYALYAQELIWWAMFAFSLTMVILSPAKRIQAAMERKFLSSKKKEKEEQTSGKFFPSQVGAAQNPAAQASSVATASAVNLPAVTAQSFKYSPRGYSVILNSPNKHNKLRPEHLNHATEKFFSAPVAMKISTGEVKKF